MNSTKFVLLACCMIFIAACGKRSKAVDGGNNTNQAVISFEERRIDVGTISAKDSCCTFVFNFTNKGNEALILSKLKTSCSCIIADYSKKPIAPGDKGQIKVNFFTEGKKGHFSKSIYIKSNAANDYEVLYIKGVIN